MSKHDPIHPDPANGRRRAGSLVERAARAYGFEAAGRVPPLRDAEPLAAAPAAPLPNERALAPLFRGRAGTVQRARLAEAGFILPGQAPSALSEEFRVIKRPLLTAAADGGALRTILVASARPDEGKTFCAINLALSLAAETEIEVVLVDGDVAKPDIVATLGLEDGPGLLDALADPGCAVETCLIRTDIPHLSVLPAGAARHEATELLASARTRALFETLRAQDPRRILVIDSPPALAASPAGVLAALAGQAVVVVRADRTGEADLRHALELLSACPRPQLLLNGVEFRPGARRFAGYYGIEA
ncbi:exopolysaccharide biosynthesis protein [Sphingomonas morindae]|uniref:Exopolysaccharide biosynthesis protein n=1 Tax=Sphingomonas morindae TaxID=1541170 RepID=A0ABY4X5G5_9SPHN|nr:exopolysaccharide biosynthesis protein [Sphingomonas morindae]USI72121.1 exopolysaccharide biosynthesis protein [Sphingomonas morindae]